MWVRGKSIAINFLPKFIKLFFMKVPFKKGSGVDTGRTMSLNIDKVALVFFTAPTKKIIKTDIVKGSRRLKTRNMSTERAIFDICTHDHRHSVPPD